MALFNGIPLKLQKRVSRFQSNVQYRTKLQFRNNRHNLINVIFFFFFQLIIILNISKMTFKKISRSSKSSLRNYCIEAKAVIILYNTVYALHIDVSRHLQIEEKVMWCGAQFTRGSYVCVQKKRSRPSFRSV